jgi:hypothetical protein
MLSTSIKKVLCKAIVLLFSFCLPLFLLTATPLSPISGLAKDTEESQHSENHVFLHNYNETDAVATCKAAGPVAAGLAIAATGVSTVTAANDIVEITTGVSPLKEGVVALGGNEDIYNGIRTGLDVATMLTPGGGGKTKVVEGALGFAASHSDDAGRVVARAAGTQADRLDDTALVLRGGESKTGDLLANQAKDSRGHISANSANNASITELATTPQPFRHGQVSVTTVGQIRDIGMDVIPDRNTPNPLHASIVPKNNPMTDPEAEALSAAFERMPNAWK